MNKVSPILIFQDNEPYFACGGEIEGTLALSFGSDNYDDVVVSEVDFHIELLKRGTEWFAILYEDTCINFGLRATHKPKVDALVAQLNWAMQTRNNFDLAPYIDDWKRQDYHFRATVKRSYMGQ